MPMKNTDAKIWTYQGEYDQTIPNVTVAEFILNAIQLYGNEVACINSETRQTLSYDEVIRQVKSLAAGLQIKYNVQPREHVAIALPLCMEYPIATLAVQLCGATAVMINPAQSLYELNHVVKLTSPIKLWITSPHFSSKLDQIYKVSADKPPCIGPMYSNEWASLIGTNQPVQLPKINAKEDVAFIFFSSGTTGLPKGVQLTHANGIAARKLTAEMAKGFPRSGDTVSAAMLPPYHTAGFSSLIESLAVGIRYVVIPNFSFHNMLQAVQDFKISVLLVVPAIAVQMAKLPVEKKYDLSSLFLLRSGSGPVSKETIDILQQKLNCMYHQVYGQTESTLATHMNFLDYNKEGSIGVVRPFTESKVVDIETNQDLGPYKEGEICVRGALVMKGYIGNEEATRNTIDSDGWLHSGDIGYYDEEGYFFITDRLKELIKYNGFQVSPNELEQILLTHPEVLDAGVSSIPDEVAGELPRAFVVRRPGSKVTEEELAQFVSDKVSAYKRLRGGVVFINEIPKNSTSKILRRELKKIGSKL